MSETMAPSIGHRTCGQTGSGRISKNRNAISEMNNLKSQIFPSLTQHSMAIGCRKGEYMLRLGLT